MKKIILLFSFLAIVSCGKDVKKSNNLDSTKEITETISNSETIPNNPLKEAYFGETHVHTAYSLDAFIGGNRMTPDMSLKFAQGEKIVMEASGKTMQLKRPLDFVALTDHAEYIGEMYSILNPKSKEYNNEQAISLRAVDNLKDGLELFVELVVKSNRGSTPKHLDLFEGPSSMVSAWEIMIKNTEKHYKPGKFTTLHAFEWSAAPNGGNLHRNVIFRDDVLPEMPVSYIEVNRETKLWEWLEEITKNGSTVLAIPHNSNASKGTMFDENMPDGNPITVEYAKMRQKFERTIEMMQVKGNSEVVSRFWGNDEFADFENANSIEDFSGRVFEEKNFVRYALKKGLQYKIDLGVNPYKLGFNGGTDNHNGLTSNVEEDNYLAGSHGYVDQTAADRVKNTVDGWLKAYDLSPGSLTGVWAPRNTREDIWDGLYNRETFATSGPRMKVRFFAGYGYNDTYNSYDAFVKDGYHKGVPMGGDLVVKDGESPSFLVWALKDPINANLDRVQVIKGWYENGELFEKIYNVAVSDNRLNEDGSVTPTDAKVNLNTGAFDTTKGSNQFMATWTDPDFNPDQISFYYVRALQLPTARWTLWDEIRENVTYPDNVAKTIQERVWSSPIWYSPK